MHTNYNKSESSWFKMWKLQDKTADFWSIQGLRKKCFVARFIKILRKAIIMDEVFDSV